MLEDSAKGDLEDVEEGLEQDDVEDEKQEQPQYIGYQLSRIYCDELLRLNYDYAQWEE
jgi:hypothetical protein